MAKYETSEVFMSIEGEAKYAGHPTVYIRFAKCNFQCRGFGNPENLDTTSLEVLGFDPKNYKDIYTIPLITRGCDSIYSWDEKFSHMWKVSDEHELGNEVLKVLPHNSYNNPQTGKRVILSLTGGEPTLRAKFIPTLLNADEFKDVEHILIETNCAVPLQWKFIEAMNQWLCANPKRKLTWSNSPKLSDSGEKWEDAIKPDVAAKQRVITGNVPGQMEQYFKFVCGPTERDFDEVAKAMDAYYGADIPRDIDVYIMPIACTEEQQQAIASKVAGMCIDRGYIYCHRIQNSVFGNGVGT